VEKVNRKERQLWTMWGKVISRKARKNEKMTGKLRKSEMVY